MDLPFAMRHDGELLPGRKEPQMMARLALGGFLLGYVAAPTEQAFQAGRFIHMIVPPAGARLACSVW